MTQLTLTDALAQRDAALEAVERNADRVWLDQALDAIRQVCETHAEWHADRIWETGLPSPREARALGPVVLKAIRLGWCVKTDRVLPSVRSHGSGKPVFVSLIFAGSASERAA